LFSIGCAEDKQISEKSIGKLYKCLEGNDAVSLTKCGNCEQSANGSERANESGEQGSASILKE
jgi:hypothetical protein